MVTTRDPGKRNKRVAVERNTRSPAGTGQLTDVWAEAFKRWAEVTPVTGGEKFKGHQLQAETNWVLFLPSDSLTRAITVKDRIKWSGRTLAILSAIDIEAAQTEVMLQCKEIQ